MRLYRGGDAMRFVILYLYSAFLLSACDESKQQNAEQNTLSASRADVSVYCQMGQNLVIEASLDASEQIINLPGCNIAANCQGKVLEITSDTESQEHQFKTAEQCFLVKEKVSQYLAEAPIQTSSKPIDGLEIESFCRDGSAFEVNFSYGVAKKQVSLPTCKGLSVYCNDNLFVMYSDVGQSDVPLESADMCKQGIDSVYKGIQFAQSQAEQ